MGLTEYKKKRHFSRTPEPAGKTESGKQRRYVIQKHDATRLHYDFRLELDGVLKSWAVPKGPSLDPRVKRLAVQVEDHPVAYRDFEGVIPQGEYGGGTVMLWDQGEWEPIGDPQKGLKSGKLKFQIRGEKLQGHWTLVRTHSAGGRDDSRQWLLIKENDDQARPESEGDILVEKPLSITSGRDLEEIASDQDRVWSSKASSRTGAKTPDHPANRERTNQASKPLSVKSLSEVGLKQAMPVKVEVQLATLTEAAPQGEQWLHEIKFDGYRMICRIDASQIDFISRNHQNWTKRLEDLVEAVRKLNVQQAILDGEVVVIGADGGADFQSLQNAFRDHQARDMKYMVFDLLYLNGRSLTQAPLEQRKEILKSLLEQSGRNDAVLFSDHIRGSGETFHQHACKLHLEGMISKRADQPYRPGRGCDWLKIKCLHNEELVIGGYTEPSGSRKGFGALLVGFHDDKGELHYAGKVGTGFDQSCLIDLTQRLEKLEQQKSPFADLQRKTGDVRTAHWVKPDLVGQFSFGSRTRDGHLRHASFQGLREDKPAGDVTLDQPTPIEKAVRQSGKPKASRPGRAAKARAKPVGTASSKASAPRKSSPQDDGAADTFDGVRLTHPEKVLYPDAGITKRELAEYYRNVADWLLPQVKHRPVVLVRCPDGQQKECFYQKHPGVGTPPELRQIPIRESSKTEKYAVVDNSDALIALAQVSALELHVWGSREDQLERPDRLIFDLDPAPEVPWKVVVESARLVRDFLQELGLESFPKTTGGKGLHLVIPIQRRHDWTTAKEFCKNVAEAIEAAAESRFTANMSKRVRTNRIFVDYLRNGRGATAIAAYSPRSRPGAPVSVPLTWAEVSSRITSDHFTIRNVMKRLAGLSEDPWAAMNSTRQSLAGPIKKLHDIVSQSAN